MNLLKLFDIALGYDGVGWGNWKTYDYDVQVKFITFEDKKILVFQGTNIDYNPTTGMFKGSLKDLLIDAQFWPNFKSKGFPTGLSKILPILEKAYDDFFPVSGSYDLIMGWSLGGMCAMECARFSNANIITFGAPPIWPQFLKEKPKGNVLHVIREDDGLIPFYPSFCYNRPGSILTLGSGPKKMKNHTTANYRGAIESLPF